MTTGQFKEIHSLLSIWRTERLLTNEMQRIGFIPNVLEEITEFYRAKNEYEQIDALCDILVFTFNTYPNINKVCDTDAVFEVLGEDLTITLGNFIRNRRHLPPHEPIILASFAIRGIKLLGYDPYKCLLETIKEISSRSGEYKVEQKKFVKFAGAYSLAEAIEMLKTLGLPTKNTDEKLELKEDKKFWYFSIGGKSATIAKWYKADYSKAKLTKDEIESKCCGGCKCGNKGIFAKIKNFFKIL